MATSTYEEALRRLLAHEGGYSNHPSDPGGPTNFGITIRDYRKYINSAGTAANVRRLTVGQAKAIYKAKYWDAMRCGALPAGVDYAVFDYGVNSGIGRAPKVLKRVIGLDAADSSMTPQVMRPKHGTPALSSTQSATNVCASSSRCERGRCSVSVGNEGSVRSVRLD
jgi:hypothetical protein